jgi:hypothetical protein
MEFVRSFGAHHLHVAITPHFIAAVALLVKALRTKKSRN